MKQSKFLQRFRIDKPGRFRLADMDPGDTAGLRKGDAKSALAQYTDRIPELQEKLYAQDQWAVLVILQGVDAAGKDGAIEHVMSGLNPQGCVVHSFKAPSAEQLDHDYLWRAASRLPPRGDIGIFNRS